MIDAQSKSAKNTRNDKYVTREVVPVEKRWAGVAGAAAKNAEDKPDDPAKAGAEKEDEVGFRS